MGIRTICFLLAVFLTGHVPLWVVLILIVAALVLPYVSVVFANGGREPENAARFDDRTAPDRNQISGSPPEIQA